MISFEDQSQELSYKNVTVAKYKILLASARKTTGGSTEIAN